MIELFDLLKSVHISWFLILIFLGGLGDHNEWCGLYVLSARLGNFPSRLHIFLGLYSGRYGNGGRESCMWWEGRSF